VVAAALALVPALVLEGMPPPVVVYMAIIQATAMATAVVPVATITTAIGVVAMITTMVPAKAKAMRVAASITTMADHLVVVTVTIMAATTIIRDHLVVVTMMVMAAITIIRDHLVAATMMVMERGAEVIIADHPVVRIMMDTTDMDSQDRKDRLVLQDHKDRLDLQAAQVPQERLDRQVQTASAVQTA